MTPGKLLHAADVIFYHSKLVKPLIGENSNQEPWYHCDLHKKGLCFLEVWYLCLTLRAAANCLQEDLANKNLPMWGGQPLSAVASSFPVGCDLNIPKHFVILFSRILGTTSVVLFLKVKNAIVSWIINLVSLVLACGMTLDKLFWLQ